MIQHIRCAHNFHFDTNIPSNILIKETFQAYLNTNMCLPTSTSIISPKKDNNTTLKILVGGLSICTIGLLISTIVLIGVNNGNENSSSNASSPASLSLSNGIDFMQSKASSDFFSSLEDNVCAGAKLALENKLCADWKYLRHRRERM